MKSFVYNLPPKSEKKNFIFNMIGSLTNAVVSMLLTIVVKRVIGESAAGVFLLAYPTAQMMFTIGVFEMRNIQVTDAKREFSFESISMFRLISIAAMWIFFVVFVILQGFDKETITVMIALTAYMMFMAFSDLFQGNLHRNGYLSLAGRSLSCETLLAAIAFSVVLIITKELLFAAIAMPIVIFVWILLHDVPLNNNFDKFKPSFKILTQTKILLCALPLFSSSFMHQYIFNSPKYAIESILTKEDQAHYGYLVMPVFCINLLSIFVFRPQLITLSKNWAEKQFSSFKKTVVKLYIWVAIVTVAALAGGYLLGLPVLELLYGADLSGKRPIFMVLLLSGGFSAASTLTLTLFTTMRKQWLCLVAYLITMLFALTVPEIMVASWGLMGAAVSYLCEMILLFTVMFISFVISINKERV